MRIIVVGGGVIGVTSAYWLRLAGHEVALIEQDVEAGRGVSAGNGGQLSYAYVEPLAGPDLWTKFPAILLGLDSAVRMRPDLSLDSIRWGLSFLRHCIGKRQTDSLKSLLVLAAESHRALAELLNDVPLQFDYAAAGKLILYRDAKALDEAGRLAEIKRQHGFRIETLGRARCLALEPALDRYRNGFAGGIYAPEDAAGDCGLFTRGLYDHLGRAMGVETHGSMRVTHLTMRDGRVVGVELDTDDMRADAVVLANGIDAPRLAATVGLKLPIEPVKGYSITAPARPDAPIVSLTDRAEKIVFAHLGHRLRAAAFADLDGWSPSVNPKRAQQLLALALHLFPAAADWDRAEPIWAGQRPMTPSGMPLIGASRVPGLYLNAGHGGLGWTLACGAGKRLAGIIA
ncbi:FAD-dependent oxidoreductase [Dongia deserti]|uniref:FAD-dependent oxidoreductase n=1 Tax=Dongia deserti TaxID=2268030 RepID=UPI000E6499D4|nr:FAD-dependent oxidoreductase [Dongia deserti]